MLHVDSWQGGIPVGSVYQNRGGWIFKHKNTNKYFSSFDAAIKYRYDYNKEHDLLRNMWREVDGHYEVQLGRGCMTLIDAEDFPILATKKWWICRHPPNRPGLVYAESNDHVKLHRVITNFAWTEVDHINRNGLDNRKANLRDGLDINQRNRRGNRNNTSGKTGVSPHTYKGNHVGWITSWREGGKQRFKRFSATKCGSLECAFQAALEWRVDLDNKLDNKNGYSIVA